MKYILQPEHVLDVDDERLLSDQQVVVEDGIILSVEKKQPDAGSGVDTTVIRHDSGVLMPGFIEMHSHMHISGTHDNFQELTSEDDNTLLIRAVSVMRDALLSGVTTMRDLGAKNEISLAVRHAIASGIIPGPQLIIAGSPITTTGGHCNMFGIEADTKEEAVAAVRAQFKAGVDWIKIMATGGNFTPGTNPKRPQYDQDILNAVVDDAHRLGLKVAAHCHATEGVQIAAQAGVDNIIHCSWNAEASEELYDYKPEVADLISKKGIFVDPTLALNYLNEIRGRKKPAPANANPKLRMEILYDMWQRGIKFVTGMDSGMTNAYFGDFAYIPQVMVEQMGITTMEAVVCATKTSAECLDLYDSIGSVTPGKKANLIITDANPVDNITALHNVSMIMKEGSLVKKDGKILI
tara:strand:+ start:21584 stop:22807 length:1224 start_codon:yes stop_codon:yes gene_type:complete